MIILEILIEVTIVNGSINLKCKQKGGSTDLA